MPDNIDPMIVKNESIAAADPEVETEADVVMQSYPSPTVNEQNNTPFYHTDPRQDQQSQSELEQQHGEPDQLEEPPTPRQQMRPTISSAEELQLAAQLSQGLAHGIPMMDPTEDHNLQHVIAHHGLEQHDQDLQHHEDHLDHNHEQLTHDGLQQHDGLSHHGEHVQDHLHDHVHDHDHTLSEGTSNNQLQLHGQQQGIPTQTQSQHQFLSDQDQQSQQHLQPAAPMDHLGAAFQLTDNTPPRKRSKVSRACDECRRKKVKCDAPSDTGEEQCSNCRRANIRCMFSRIPQKRGPSKGYIKELADRINHIEGKLASEGANADSLSDLLRRDSNDFFQSGQPDPSSRKRPYSSVAGDQFGTPTSARQQTFSSEPRPIQPYGTPTDRFRPPYSSNSLAPTPLAAKPDSGTPSRPAAVMDGVSLDLDNIDQAREVDETAFAAYLTVIHPTFPVLATARSRLDAQLSLCTPLLRAAFIEALHSAVQSFPSFNGTYGNDLASAARLIADWETDMAPRQDVVNLVHLQTLILIAIATDNYGPAALKGEHGGASKSNILGRAVGLAYSMRLHLAQVDENIEVPPDVDSDENVTIRTWWTLIMLDRWNAISTASPLFIPNESVVILPSLELLMGQNVYHLTRLSNILGHFAPVALTAPTPMVHRLGATPVLDSFFTLCIDLFREMLPTVITPETSPVVHFAYWHCRTLAYLFQGKARETNLMWCSREATSLLLANTELLSPLNHHFFCLAALTLMELTKLESHREEATSKLKELLEAPVALSSWNGIIRERMSEQLNPSTTQASMEATASQSLQHLADLATATELEVSAKHDKAADAEPRSNEIEDTSINTQALTRAGYLNAITEFRSPLVR
ncbi:hypothetical protein BX600DRAFT_511229 [Xylariales sp. PMI_506]|nr:hypothetical protein BX600DRAFT_511229 [Xylariales sp. PMI_506]